MKKLYKFRSSMLNCNVGARDALKGAMFFYTEFSVDNFREELKAHTQKRSALHETMVMRFDVIMDIQQILAAWSGEAYSYVIPEAILWPLRSHRDTLMEMLKDAYANDDHQGVQNLGTLLADNAHALELMEASIATLATEA